MLSECNFNILFSVNSRTRFVWSDVDVPNDFFVISHSVLCYCVFECSISILFSYFFFESERQKWIRYFFSFTIFLFLLQILNPFEKFLTGTIFGIFFDLGVETSEIIVIINPLEYAALNIHIEKLMVFLKFSFGPCLSQDHDHHKYQ